MESGWGKNYLCTEILRTWYSGLQMRRRATGESPIDENSVPMQSGLTIESAKEECVWESGQGSLKAGSLAWPPCDFPPAQTTIKRRRKQLRTRPCELNKLWYWDYILLLEHIYLSSQKCSDEYNKVFCLMGWHSSHLPHSISSPYLQETQNQICVLNGTKQLRNIFQQRNLDIKLDALCLFSCGGKIVTKQQNTF